MATDGPNRPPTPEEQADLLARARAGEEGAMEQLISRQIPQLRRWAHGKLPNSARGAMDTEDLIQDSLLRLWRILDTFEDRGDGSLSACARTVLNNLIKDRYKAAANRYEVEEFRSLDFPIGASPSAAAARSESFDRYLRALKALKDDDQFAVIARMELGCSYGEIGKMLDGMAEDTVRKRVQRSLDKIREQLASSS